MSTRDIGARGEARAAEFLKKKGYKILETNFSTHFGEIDIIAGDHKSLVFVEVKFRSTEAFGSPAEAVNKKKQGKIIRSALSYVKSRRLEGRELRFDVLGIGPGEEEPELIRNAFSSDGGYTL